MRVDDECCQCIILLLVHLVLDNCQDIETRKNGLCKIHIIGEVECVVVVALNGIGCGDNTATGLQRRDNTGLRDRNGLLLHSLVNRCTILVIHLIELIDEAQALISQHQCSTLECPLSRDGVFMDTGSETDCRGTLTSGVNAAVEHLLHVLKELRLGSTGVSQEQNVDVTSDAMLTVDVLGFTAEHCQRQGLLYELMTVN